MGWEWWGKSESSVVWVPWSTQINISSNSTERILGFCSGFSESQMETPSTTSKANPSGFTAKKKKKTTNDDNRDVLTCNSAEHAEDNEA